MYSKQTDLPYQAELVRDLYIVSLLLATEWICFERNIGKLKEIMKKYLKIIDFL